MRVLFDEIFFFFLWENIIFLLRVMTVRRIRTVNVYIVNHVWGKKNNNNK